MGRYWGLLCLSPFVLGNRYCIHKVSNLWKVIDASKAIDSSPFEIKLVSSLFVHQLIKIATLYINCLELYKRSLKFGRIGSYGAYF